MLQVRRGVGEIAAVVMLGVSGLFGADAVHACCVESVVMLGVSGLLGADEAHASCVESGCAVIPVSHLRYRAASASPVAVSHCKFVVGVVTPAVGENGLVRLSLAIVSSEMSAAG